MLFQVKIGRIHRDNQKGDYMVESEQRLSKSLQGFQLSRNEAAEYLMRELEVQFVQVPLKMELNLQNRIRWTKEKGISGVISGVFARIIVGGRIVGRYDQQYGVVLVPKDNLFTELHENGHALVDSINPSIRDVVDELPIMIVQRIAGKPVKLENIERIVTYRCFNEGVAQWGTLRTARGLTEHFEPEDVLSMENSMLRGMGSDDVTIFIQDEFRALRQKILHGTESDRATDFIPDQFRALRQVVSIYKTALSQTGLKVMIKWMKAESQLLDPQYVVGYRFVDGAMQTLINSGRQVGEALTELVRKPPERIDDLERPQEYAVRVKP